MHKRSFSFFGRFWTFAVRFLFIYFIFVYFLMFTQQVSEYFDNCAETWDLTEPRPLFDYEASTVPIAL